MKLIEASATACKDFVVLPGKLISRSFWPLDFMSRAAADDVAQQHPTGEFQQPQDY
ncbi:MAG: hypothetical protein ACREU9_02025 [Gammaproteobacteria bacterium]